MDKGWQEARCVGYNNWHLSLHVAQSSGEFARVHSIMCGIAGLVSLTGQRSVDVEVLRRMSAQLVHRGRDDESMLAGTGFGFAFRRLSMVGIPNGRQPLESESGSVTAVVNGEFFDYRQKREALEARGHVFRTDSDSEIAIHLWEDLGEEFFAQLQGQFALALHDAGQRRFILARDRFGICPLFYAQAGDWLLFASEIKALLASGLIDRQADLRGLDQMFTFFGMPGSRTAFQGIRSIAPGKYLRITLPGAAGSSRITELTYWDFDFPDAESPSTFASESEAAAQLSCALSRSVQNRFAADTPVACLLSGGVDSAVLAQMQADSGGRLPAAFTAQVVGRGLDESQLAAQMARRLNVPQHIVRFEPESVAALLPDVVRASDSPVADLTAGCHYALGRAISASGYKAVVSGEGADEAFAGYSWFKAHKLLRAVSCFYRPWYWAIGKAFRFLFRSPANEFHRIQSAIGGLHAQNYIYAMTSRVRWLLLRDEIRNAIGDETAYDQLQFDTARIKRWHPLNQSLYFGYKTHLPGLLLSQRGDRTAMANGVEVRYPFLDENVVDLCSRLPAAWKLRGLSGDKHLLRRVASGILPKRIAMRKKAMFRAAFGRTILGSRQPFVRQLLSTESLNRTCLFDVSAVGRMLRRLRRSVDPPVVRDVVELSLCTVVGTQLWWHLYLGGELCELPRFEAAL